MCKQHINVHTRIPAKDDHMLQGETGVPYTKYDEVNEQMLVSSLIV